VLALLAGLAAAAVEPVPVVVAESESFEIVGRWYEDGLRLYVDAAPDNTPVLAAQLALPGGAQTIAMALGATGATFLALSGWVLATRRDFSFMGGFLFAGMVIAILAGLAAMFFQMPALGLAVSAMVALLSAGLILFETSRIVNGGETNYVLATVGLFVSLFNLFTSLLSLFGLGGND